MEIFWEKLMAWDGEIGVICGLTSLFLSIMMAIPVWWTWYAVLYGKKRKYRKWQEKMRKNPGKIPCILGVDAKIGGDPESAIRRFCLDSEALKEIVNNKDRCFWLHWKQNLVPEDMEVFRTKLLEKITEMFHSGADTIHLFYAGPVTLAFLIGGELANSGRVMLYQYQNGEYQNMGAMKRPF